VHRLEQENILEFAGNYPAKLWKALLRVANRSGVQLYLVGGTVRDCLLGRASHDLDIAVSARVFPYARMLLGELGGGTIVDLSGPEDEACRVVWQKEQIDLSAFRAKTNTIDEDLRLRDFTINAMGVQLLEVVGDDPSCTLIDPTGGMADLRTGRVRHCLGAFVADPVRMLRGYRLCATLGFHMTKETSEEIKQHASLINTVAAERIDYELAMIFERVGIDTEEVLEAAGTKWNFLPFRPGLVGGHCIGVDPYYLTYKAQQLGYHPQMILAGRRINDNMSSYVATQIIKKMLTKRIQPMDSRVLILGLAFKENCPDIRNTKVVDIISELASFGAAVDVCDPWVDAADAKSEYDIDLVSNPKKGEYDVVVIAVAHDQFQMLGERGIRNYCKQESIVYDIKYVLPADVVDDRL
jgi:hypothetical protein